MPLASIESSGTRRLWRTGIGFFRRRSAGTAQNRGMSAPQLGTLNFGADPMHGIRFTLIPHAPRWKMKRKPDLLGLHVSFQQMRERRQNLFQHVWRQSGNGFRQMRQPISNGSGDGRWIGRVRLLPLLNRSDLSIQRVPSSFEAVDVGGQFITGQGDSRRM